MALDRNRIAASISAWAFDFAELTALMDALQRPPPAAIRLRPGVLADQLPFATAPVPWHPRGRFVTDHVRPGASLEFAVGDYYIQDAASLLAVALLVNNIPASRRYPEIWF